jgi:hypothetical protein
MKYYLLLFLLIIFKNHSICLGITNERKYKDVYMIDVSSDDLPIFIEKLYLFLDKVKFDFYMFLIVFVSLFLFTYIIIVRFILKKFDKYLIFSILILISFMPFSKKWKEYNLGIQSAQNAIYNFHSTMDNEVRQILDPDDPEKLKFKTIYIGDEIRKYGLHAIFCEIPGKLQSQNANPKSFLHIIGGSCYKYFSQRKYLDPNDPFYVGDEKSRKFKTIKPNNLNIFF